MNDSGGPLFDVKQFFKADPENFLIVYDDIDIPLGTLRFRKGGGTGGHKGIESIIYQMQSEDFNRLRMGIATDDEMKPSEKRSKTQGKPSWNVSFFNEKGFL